MAKHKKNAYLLRGVKPPTAFIRDPDYKGVWRKVHPCVLLHHCPDTKCGARAGEMCRGYGSGNYIVVHHVTRARNWPEESSELPELTDGEEIDLRTVDVLIRRGLLK